MKKIFLALAIIGMTGFAFGQQQAASKDSKDSKTCTHTCTDKSCKKGACVKSDKKASSTSSSTSTTTKSSSDKK